MLVSLSTLDYCLNSYLFNAVKHRCSVSKVYARPTLGITELSAFPLLAEAAGLPSPQQL